MPRSKSIVPTYRLHKATNQAVVTITGPNGSRRDAYLGAFGSDASIIEFGRTLIEWKCGGTSALRGETTFNKMLLAFWRHAESHYGEKSKELSAYRYALKPLRQLFGPTAAAQFGPKALRSVRDPMIERGWCRQLVNRQINRVRRVFRWAVSEELIPSSVLHALETLPGLARGRSPAPEAPRVRPASDEDINSVLPYLSSVVRAIVLFQRYTGCRPGEAVQLRLTDVDRSGPVWLHRPRQHKGLWLGREKIIAIGPQAQAAIQTVLTTELAIDAPVFSPQRAVAERLERLRKKRQTPVQPSQVCRKTKTPKKGPGNQYTTMSYNRAAAYGIRRARAAGVIVADWHVNQLRHTRATEIRRLHGIETASATLGHAELRKTEIYAEKNLAQTIKVAAETG